MYVTSDYLFVIVKILCNYIKSNVTGRYLPKSHVIVLNQMLQVGIYQNLM